MTHKQRILAACRGEVPDCIPWIPRLIHGEPLPH